MRHPAAWLAVLTLGAVIGARWHAQPHCGIPQQAAQDNHEPVVDLPTIQSSPAYTQGRGLFMGLCTRCHMETGEGQPGLVPTLHGAPFTVGDPGAFARILLHGMEGPVTVKGQHYNAAMPPATFDADEELAAVMTFVRNSWGNAAGPVTPELVARVKRETRGRVKTWTEGELNGLP